jgi:hypothetical protein
MGSVVGIRAGTPGPAIDGINEAVDPAAWGGGRMCPAGDATFLRTVPPWIGAAATGIGISALRLETVLRWYRGLLRASSISGKFETAGEKGLERSPVWLRS